MRKVQYVWWNSWHGITFFRWNGPYGYWPLDFSIHIGFLEIRVWKVDAELSPTKDAE